MLRVNSVQRSEGFKASACDTATYLVKPWGLRCAQNDTVARLPSKTRKGHHKGEESLLSLLIGESERGWARLKLHKGTGARRPADAQSTGLPFPTWGYCFRAFDPGLPGLPDRRGYGHR